MDNRMIKYIIVIVVVLVVIGMIGWRIKNKVNEFEANVSQEVMVEAMVTEEMPMMDEMKQ